MSIPFTSETEMAPPVISWLLERGFVDIYHEVQIRKWGGARADIVAVSAVKPRLVVVVELKRSLSIDLLAQADHWRRLAHYVYIAVPRQKNGGDEGRRFAYTVAAEHGIGVLELDKRSGWGPIGDRCDVVAKGEPTLQRRIDPRLLESLRPEHKTAVQSGSASGGYWTAFKDTATRLRQIVERHPDGIPLRTALDELKEHHYGSAASARGALSRLARSGVIDGVTTEYAGRTLLLKPIAR